MQNTFHAWRWLAAALLVVVLAACGAPGVISPHPASTPASTPTLPVVPTVVGAGASAENAYLSQLAVANTFRGSVLIARNGVVLLSKGYGPADEARKLPDTPQTRFRIGSITKQFTAMAILILQERGKLHVQDHLCLYIEDCPQDWQPITLA